jgi:hypothetical protein
VEGCVTGVIAQDGAMLGTALAKRFGEFPMDWWGLKLIPLDMTTTSNRPIVRVAWNGGWECGDK